MRLKILANGHDVTRDRAQVLHERNHFVKRLSESHHDAALGLHAAHFEIATPCRAPQQSQGLFVTGVGSDTPIEPRDRFRVVIEDVRLRIQNRIERRFIAVEIRNQHFNAAFRIERAHLPHSFRPVGSATVRQIVTVN